MNLVRGVTALASPGGRRGRLLTFFFHRVLEQPDPMQPGELDARRFDQVLGWIGEQFQVLAPIAACTRWADGNLPPRAAMITFDDGYRDNHDVAMPILKRHGMTAAFFIATGYLGEGVQFNDRLTEAFRDLQRETFDAHWLGLGVLPTASLSARLATLEKVREAVKYLAPGARKTAVERIEADCDSPEHGLQRGRVMMTEQEVVALADNGMEIGGHTVTHPILTALDDAAAFDEIASGQRALQTMLGRPPVLFAYPNGRPGTDFDQRHTAMARRAGFAYAFSTRRGVATRASDPMMLPRFMPWNTERLRFQLQALRLTLGH